jgi:hypothetical protein
MWAVRGSQGSIFGFCANHTRTTNFVGPGIVSPSMKQFEGVAHVPVDTRRGTDSPSSYRYPMRAWKAYSGLPSWGRPEGQPLEVTRRCERPHWAPGALQERFGARSLPAAGARLPRSRPTLVKLHRASLLGNLRTRPLIETVSCLSLECRLGTAPASPAYLSPLEDPGAVVGDTPLHTAMRTHQQGMGNQRCVDAVMCNPRQLNESLYHADGSGGASARSTETNAVSATPIQARDSGDGVCRRASSECAAATPGRNRRRACWHQVRALAAGRRRARSHPAWVGALRSSNPAAGTP